MYKQLFQVCFYVQWLNNKCRRRGTKQLSKVLIKKGMHKFAAEKVLVSAAWITQVYYEQKSSDWKLWSFIICNICTNVLT
jgi:hypothetical protein